MDWAVPTATVAQDAFDDVGQRDERAGKLVGQLTLDFDRMIPDGERILRGGRTRSRVQDTFFASRNIESNASHCSHVD